MLSCHPWLGCEELNKVEFIKHLGKGAVKNVSLVKWNDIPIVVSLPANAEYMEDFRNGIEALKSLNPSQQVVQLIGYCDEPVALYTEYHPFGNAADFFTQFGLKNLTIGQSLGFCLQYSEILRYLHNHTSGPRVFCDSNSLDKLLSQLLVTSQLTLILNDADALPVVLDSSGIKCGHRQLEGTFVAPEQLWHIEGEFSDDLMPGYNEKTDIWKAASVCDYFLRQSDDGESVRYRLFDLHSRCKRHDPKLRPSANELRNEYISVINEYNSHSEL
ncbi:protein O-mannose kinase-like [Macrosteles quadrilineatus]|uniref:protein O-mannose kinase-like n=1 Tax=Macrosteles quadrilineatus TaxID=74068 RepID=UPI0023E1B855|nr:protein O-mannose kinase-like [Macrosteles quadrilineatus]